MNILNGIKQWVHENTMSPEERVAFVTLVIFLGSVACLFLGFIIWITGGWAILPIIVIFAVMAVLMVWLVPEDQ